MSTVTSVSPPKAWEALMKGNLSWTNADIDEWFANFKGEITAEAKQLAVGGQDPYATIICCSDSRVLPNVIFCEGLGLLFVVRVAGNVIDQAAVGSVEFAVAFLKTNLVVILGHEGCGAVGAALDATEADKGKYPGIDYLVDAIAPAVARAKKKYDLATCRSECHAEAMKENTFSARRDLLKLSPVCKEKYESGELKVVCAGYSLGDQNVERYEEEGERSLSNGE
eukprot:TRINITY_DN265_c0_g1_i1.p2 TRINITY_DN265_c0_g1~~TRINITY_DN265_c0_g1_i1.p2  ORF type:complete len:237 (-),score=46.54 TRINITY_DN265_c0_g1_i1:1040-1714(-)